jgi:hypothetical protein
MATSLRLFPAQRILSDNGRGMEKGLLFEEALSVRRGLKAPAHPSSKPGIVLRPSESVFFRKARLLANYFFLVFFVAFFFIVLFSLGLDLAVALPGFFLTGITHLL